MTALAASISRSTKLAQMYASDTSADGDFITGVTSTGIYCLPSCRARKPLAENVVFFSTEEEARAAGLRPCKRCRPDDFYAGHNDDRERLAVALAVVTADPAVIGCIADLASLAGFGRTKLHRVAVDHTGLTPGELLHRTRIQAAQHLLRETDLDITQVGFSVGYQSVSAFYERFRATTGVTPAMFRLNTTSATPKASRPLSTTSQPSP